MNIMDNLVPLSSTKSIYTQKNRPDLFVKVFDLKTYKLEDIQKEIRLQIIGASIDVSPPIINTYYDTDRYYITMKRIKGMSIADFYGSNYLDIPGWVWNEIRRILKELYINGVQYIDITPYNFMIENETNKLYIIDYGHATHIEMDWFLGTFMRGLNNWNPDFE